MESYIATTLTGAIVLWLVNRAVRDIPRKSDIDIMKAEIKLQFQQDLTKIYEQFTDKFLARLEKSEKRIEKLESWFFHHNNKK